MNIKKWVKRQISAISLATASVEKDMLNQTAVELNNTSGNFQRHNQGTLMDALTRGEITQDVIDLRWRTFRVLGASDDLNTKRVGVNELGDDIYEVYKTNDKTYFKNVKLDPSDDYPIELVVDNKNITIGGLDVMHGDSLKNHDTSEEFFNEFKTIESKTIGVISNDDYHSSIKNINPIIITRDLKPKFEIEKYAKKMNVRTISDSEKLLEFYVSVYPDIYDRKSRLLISEIEKAIINPRVSTLLEINSVGFLSYRTLGANDFHFYEYKISGFDKIIKYDGHYIIKFKSEVTINGEYLLEKYRSETLDERYKNKEAKK